METVTTYYPDGKPKKIQRTYDSWHEAIDHALDIRRTVVQGEWDSIEGGRLASRMPSLGDEWDLGCDWDRACEMVRADGWAEGLELVSEMSENFESVIGSRMLSHEPQYHVSGACVDVAAYLTGEPECFLDFAEVEKPGAGKVLSIGVACGMTQYTKAITVMRRGAAIVALIDMLEAGGYQTEVLLITKTVSFRGATGVISIPLKRASEPLPMERLAFALCHPAMPRRIDFALIEQLPKEFRVAMRVELNGTYGAVGTITEIDFDGDILLERDGNFISRAAAHKWLLRTLKDNGIELAQSPDALSVP